MTEIDKDFYCSADAFEYDANNNHKCVIGLLVSEAQGFCINDCRHKHRKWPTPEQFKEEYGRSVYNDMPVWYFNDKEWVLTEYWRYKQVMTDIQRLDKDFNAESDSLPVVVACTPWSRPDNDWRPE